MDVDVEAAASPLAPGAAPATLSYATHPAIVKRIARYACPRTKLAFRATSRTFRLFLDPIIFEHLIVDGGPDAECVESPCGSLPSEPWRLVDGMGEEMLEQMDLAEATTWPQYLPYTRVLDLTARTGFNFEVYSKYLTGLEMIRGAGRFLGRNYLPRELLVATLVDTVHLSGPQPPYFFSRRGRKQVFHVLFDPYAEHIPHASFAFDQGAARHLVFIFTPHYCKSLARQSVARANNLLCSVAGPVLRDVWFCPAEVERITIVGLADLDRRTLGLPSASSLHDLEEAVRAAFSTVAFLEPVTHEADLTNFFAKVKLVSRAEYCATVGARAFALETHVESATEPHAHPLDHTCLPHVLDRVVALAPWDSMLRLRLVSRALKARVDAALFKHVVVLPGSLPYILFVRGVGGRLPAIQALDASRNDCLVDDTLRHLFSHTRVLDIPGELDESMARAVCNLLPNLRIVRNLSPLYTQLMGAPIEVHYQTLNMLMPTPGLMRFAPNARGRNTRLVNARLIINHLYNAVDSSFSVMPILPSGRGQVADVVFIFSPFHYPPPPPPPPPPRVWAVGPPPSPSFFSLPALGWPFKPLLLRILDYLVEALSRRRMARESARLTVVGVADLVRVAADRADSEILDAVEPSLARLLCPGPDLASDILDRAFSERGTGWRVPERGETEDNLCFVEREAYVAAGGVGIEVPSLEAMYAAGWKIDE